jgi:hypothetical protein
VDARGVGAESSRVVEGAPARGLRSRPTRRVVLAPATIALATLALAARADALVYRTNFGTDTIGSASLDVDGNPASVNQRFIPNAGGEPLGMAADSAHIYWAKQEPASTIATADLGGTGVNLNFIVALNLPWDVAVDATNVYWADSGTNAIGRANSSGVNPSFISGATSPGVQVSNGVEVDGSYVYWTNGYTSSATIARAKSQRRSETAST